jgi:hypothetical protein
VNAPGALGPSDCATSVIECPHRSSKSIAALSSLLSPRNSSEFVPVLSGSK